MRTCRRLGVPSRLPVIGDRRLGVVTFIKWCSPSSTPREEANGVTTEMTRRAELKEGGVLVVRHGRRRSNRARRQWAVSSVGGVLPPLRRRLSAGFLSAVRPTARGSTCRTCEVVARCGLLVCMENGGLFRSLFASAVTEPSDAEIICSEPVPSRSSGEI